MILFLLLISRQGKVRLAKWYQNFTAKEKARIMREVCAVSLGRSIRLSNFIPFNLTQMAPSLVSGADGGMSHVPHHEASGAGAASGGGAGRHTLVSKRYASLTFVACVEASEHNPFQQNSATAAAAAAGSSEGATDAPFCPGDNELLTLEVIHYFVEALDRYFGNVCELDLIYQFQKAYMVLDEVILGGELQESNKKTILRYAQLHEQLMEDESGHGAASGGGSSALYNAASMVSSLGGFS